VGFELRASHLLGRCYTTWTTLPAICSLFICFLVLGIDLLGARGWSWGELRARAHGYLYLVFPGSCHCQRKNSETMREVGEKFHYRGGVHTQEREFSWETCNGGEVGSSRTGPGFSLCKFYSLFFCLYLEFRGVSWCKMHDGSRQLCQGNGMGWHMKQGPVSSCLCWWGHGQFGMVLLVTWYPVVLQPPVTM
jgi:hypothetical protein